MKSSQNSCNTPTAIAQC